MALRVFKENDKFVLEGNEERQEYTTIESLLVVLEDLQAHGVELTVSDELWATVAARMAR